MKRQEICQKTGLTPKALRLYEEKGLIDPERQNSGHNQVREYSEADLSRLMVIATLRRAMFTMSEIKEMLENPQIIQQIFPQYLSWLREQSQQMNQLLAASEQVDLTEVSSAEDLSRQIQQAARALPIPATDIHFRFRQLDALEDQRPSFTPTQKLDHALPAGRVFRQSVVAISRDRMDNTLALNDQLNDTWGIFDQEESGVAPQRELPLTSGQKRLRLGLTLLIVAVLAIMFLGQWYTRWALVVLAIPVAARLGLLWKDKYQRDQAWIKGLGWTESDFGEYRKRMIRIAIAVVLGLAVIGAGVAVMVELGRPVETMDGPSTENLDVQTFFLEFPPRLLNMGNLGEDFPNAYLVTERKIYFQYGYGLYSVDADYGNLLLIDTYIWAERGARSAKLDALEDPCVMFWYDNRLFYLAGEKGDYRSIYLMRYECGGKVKPQKLLEGTMDEFGALGLREDGTILIYGRDEGKWQITREVKIPEE